MEEPGELQSMESQRVGHDRATSHTYIYTYIYIYTHTHIYIYLQLYNCIYIFFKFDEKQHWFIFEEDVFIRVNDY